MAYMNILSFILFWAALPITQTDGNTDGGTTAVDTTEPKTSAPPQDTKDTEEITIIADFRGTTRNQVNTSLSVLDSTSLREEGDAHFEDALQNVPNLNWAGGTSRPRYFQIRGVGERSEYLGAPNSSVGFIVDDIDLSGLGMAADLFDLQQIEVLRGPQGTRYGANALAGLIVLKSNDPTEDTTFGGETRLGSDGLWSAGAYASGTLWGKPTDTTQALLRTSVIQRRQDGFRRNTYLNRKATNGRDELSARAKLHLQLTDQFSIDVAGLFANLNNGYDAWTLDNNGFETLTDKPGKDTQRTTGLSVRLSFIPDNEYFEALSISSVADSSFRHAYDGDWANPDYWAARGCTDDYDADGDGNTTELLPCQYDYLWDKRAKRQTLSQEFRVVSGEQGRILADSTSWTTGLYVLDLREGNDLNSSYNGFPDEVLTSTYRSTNVAAFLETNTRFFDVFSWQMGARAERRIARYKDNAPEENNSFRPRENLWGGHLSLQYHHSPQMNFYGRAARGYKAGGFNMGLPKTLRTAQEFKSEALYNYEVGGHLRSADGRATMHFAAFIMDRRQQQVPTSIQDPDNPQRFILYTNNAAASSAFGAELEFSYQPLSIIRLYGNVGLLNTRFDRYLKTLTDGSLQDLSGRALAHAPRYRVGYGLNLGEGDGPFANINGFFADGFYFSDSHNQKAKSSLQLNANVGYSLTRALAHVRISLWIRNITDTRTAVRGFYFGNEPDQGWADKLYQRYSDPRYFGLTISYDN